MPIADFDTPIDRRNSSSVKWQHYAGRDVIPMWGADMDFAAPPAVRDALVQRIEHGVFGYTLAPASTAKAVQTFLASAYGWEIDVAWLVWLPGVVAGFDLACRTACGAGDAVLMPTPNYPPCFTAPHNMECELQTVPFRLADGRWQLSLR